MLLTSYASSMQHKQYYVNIRKVNHIVLCEIIIVNCDIMIVIREIKKLIINQ